MTENGECPACGGLLAHKVGCREAISPRNEAYYDGMLERMQTPEAREAMDRAFRAAPEEMGKAAVRAASLRDGEPCDHPGCLSHVSHPCDGCGRTAGKR